MLDATGGVGKNLNTNQFKSPIAKGAATGALLGPAGAAGGALAGGAIAAAPKIAAGAGRAVGAAAGAARAIAPAAARAGALGAMANPVGAGVVAGGAAAYGAAHTPGGSSIIKGAIKGAKGPNMGLGVAGALPGAVRGAANTPGARNVVSGAAKGGLLGGLVGGPVGALGGAALGGIAGLFSHRGMGPAKAPAAGAAVPNRATPYTVKKGDTLTSIAAANKTTVDALRKANPNFTAPGSKYKNGNMIWSGTKVNLK